MAVWDFFDYAELTGKNKISEWLSTLPPADQAKIDNRLLQMIAARQWPEKWVSTYKSAGKLYEFRIKGTNVQYRPLGSYFGKLRYIVLVGAIEKGDSIPQADVDTANDRHGRVRGNEKHAVPHQFDSQVDMEEDAK
jgi:Phage derived protein Gp49-like (DUF891)